MRSIWLTIAMAGALGTIGCGDEEAPKDTESDSDTQDAGPLDTDTSSEGSPEGCVAGHDPENPALRLRAFVASEPEPLVDILEGTQGAIDEGTVTYIFALSDVTGEGEVVGLIGSGEPAAAADTYRLSDHVTLSFDVDGDNFTAEADGDVVLTIAMVSGEPLSVPMKEVVMSGTFADDARCAVGEQTAAGPPSEWETQGELAGLLTVADTKAVTVSLQGRQFTLCAYLAYGSSWIELLQDPECDAAPEAWRHPADETTSEGHAAWRISADFAATAVLLE